MAKIIVVSVLLLVFGFVGAQYNYTLALKKSVLFYEAQRSGKLVTNRIRWRGDSFLKDAQGIDLSGGYFDAGDQMKYGFPLGHSMIFLAWSLIDYKDAYVSAREYENGLASIRWGADWILKATKLDKGIVYAQVGDTKTDHDYWGRPEQFPASSYRPALTISAKNPGTDLAANYASALAATSVAFRNSDPKYSATCLTVARQLYDFADKNRGIYSISVPDAADNYPSESYQDELTFAAAFLAFATGEQVYKTAAANFWTKFGLGWVQPYFDWGSKNAGIAVILARVLGDQKYKQSAQNHCDYWINTQRKTPKGLVFIDQWGSLGLAASASFGCLLAADSGIGDAVKYRAFAQSQLDYMLGSTGRSFVVGFGVNPPTHVHHAGASCPDMPAVCDGSTYSSPKPNGQVIEGALVGGPDELDKFVDIRQNHVQNEVALDYNAGFQAALAGLIQSKLKQNS